MNNFRTCGLCNINYNADTFDTKNPHRCEAVDLKLYVKALLHKLDQIQELSRERDYGETSVALSKIEDICFESVTER